MGEAISGELTPESLDDAAMQGLIAMFDGTELTADVLMSGWTRKDDTGNPILNENEVHIALDRVWNWFTSIIPPENDQTIGEIPENPVIGLYNSLVTYHLPSEVDKQDPQLLIDVLNAKKSDTASVDDVPDIVKSVNPRASKKNRASFVGARFLLLEQVMGIEPTWPAWKAGVLPLNYTRVKRSEGCLHKAKRPSFW